MKTCPFCAEEIQDAAIVCKHCGKDQSLPAISSKESKKRLTRRLVIGVGLMLGLAFACNVVMSPGFQRGFNRGRGVDTSTPLERATEARAPTTDRMVNTMSDEIAALTESRRADALAGLLAEQPCGSVTRTFYQGIEPTSGSAFWNVRCANGRSYAIAIAADAQGSARTLDCKNLKAVEGTDCFTKFP